MAFMELHFKNAETYLKNRDFIKAYIEYSRLVELGDMFNHKLSHSSFRLSALTSKNSKVIDAFLTVLHIFSYIFILVVTYNLTKMDFIVD